MLKGYCDKVFALWVLHSSGAVLVDFCLFCFQWHLKKQDKIIHTETWVCVFFFSCKNHYFKWFNLKPRSLPAVWSEHTDNPCPRRWNHNTDDVAPWNHLNSQCKSPIFKNTMGTQTYKATVVDLTGVRHLNFETIPSPVLLVWPGYIKCDGMRAEFLRTINSRLIEHPL